ncbi:hypothetical protein BDV93DRAFT_261890 [Ceratobasidium sp. AG-I]|nr:hypothetical protein BDV93DRAFT_261890 [Ceratobasidium sp. AG-I]
MPCPFSFYPTVPIVMAGHSAPLAKRPHSPSTSNSPPVNRRAHSPEEGEVDDDKSVPSPSNRSRNSNPYANDGESPSQTRTLARTKATRRVRNRNLGHICLLSSTCASPSYTGYHNHNTSRHAPGYDTFAMPSWDPRTDAAEEP